MHMDVVSNPPSPPSCSEPAFWEAHASIAVRLQQLLHEEQRIEYCAYFEDEDGLPIDNLDEIAVSGTCVLVGPQDAAAPLAGWEGTELQDPTWLQVAKQVNRMLLECEERQRVHFEGLDWIAPHDAAVKRIEICVID